MANVSTRQNQNELLQHIAAVHEHKPGHHRDLSLEAMTEDLDHITSSPNHDAVADAGGEPIESGTRIDKALAASNAHADCIVAHGVVLASSTVAGVAGSQEGC